MSDLSKEAEKFEFYLKQHKLTFEEFKNILHLILDHGNLVELWNTLTVDQRFELGKLHNDPDFLLIQKDIEDGNVRFENGNLELPPDILQVKKGNKIN